MWQLNPLLLFENIYWHKIRELYSTKIILMKDHKNKKQKEEPTSEERTLKAVNDNSGFEIAPEQIDEKEKEKLSKEDLRKRGAAGLG